LLVTSRGEIIVNIVDLIKEQLSAELLSKLGSALGQDTAATTKAAGAAVPSILSVLMGLASNAAGADKVISALKQFDSHSVDSVTNSLRTGKATEVQSKGGDILGSLLGGGGLVSIVSGLAKFLGSNPELTKRLLSMLTPLVLGMISSQFKNRPLSSQGLSSFFQEQKSNISAAMPSGLSFADIPGLAAAAKPAAEAATAFPMWLVGLAIAALALGGLYYYFQGQQPAPEPAPAAAPVAAPTVAGEKPKVNPGRAVPNTVSETPTLITDLTKFYTGITDTLSKITDEKSAEAAVPALDGFSATLDRLKPLVGQLHEAAKPELAALQSKNIQPLKDLVAKVLAIPGVGNKLKTILDGLVAKLSEIK
jgi:hypothetical protein